jgi:hypothetical protein
MGTTDQYSQLKASNITRHPMRRIWWPLFFDIIDSASVNAYVVYREAGRFLDYRKFLLALNKELREEGSRELHFVHSAGLLEGLQRMKWPKGLPPDLKESTVYQRIELAKAYCRVCLRERTHGI